MSDELTPRHNLESLRKQARRWLNQLRKHAAGARERLERALPGAPVNPTLRDVQHALARELGVAGWAALKQRVTAAGEARTRALAPYEEKALALLEAYRTGTPAAMERHWRLTWHRRAWRGMRTYVQLDLGRQAGSANQDDDITLEDARFLVAREHGHESWEALVQAVAVEPAPGARLMPKPMRALRSEAAEDEDSGWVSRDWSAVIARMRDAEVVGLDAHGQMTDAMLAEVVPLEHLTVLRLGGSREVTDDGVRQLARMPRLRHLELNGTAVTDRGLEALGALTELETLSLAWTAVSDAGVARVAPCDGLTTVDLQGTRCGDGALRALAGKPRLARLRTGNAITDAGVAWLQDYPVFRHWQGGIGEMALLGHDARPNYLALHGRLTDRGLAGLADLDGLFALSIDDPALRLSAPGLAPLAGLPNLGWLAVDATDQSMPYIAALPHLRFLSCQDTTAGDDGFSALSRSRSLEYIWGRRCHNLRTRGFSALADLPKLQGLSVSCKNVDDTGVAALTRFPALKELMPMDVPDDGYRHIGQCTGLTSLVLMYCRETSDAATEQIVGLPRLERYFASYTRITDRTPELLSGMSSLERVTLDSCAGVTNAGVAHLARLPRLRELRVSGGRLTAEVAAPFPPGVRVHYSL